jgi:hypothetical protein
MKHFNDLYDFLVSSLKFIFDKWKIMLGKYVLVWTGMLAAFKFAILGGTIMATSVIYKVAIKFLLNYLNTSEFLSAAEAIGNKFDFHGLLGWLISITELDKSLSLILSAITAKLIMAFMPMKK